MKSAFTAHAHSAFPISVFFRSVFFLALFCLSGLTACHHVPMRRPVSVAPPVPAEILERLTPKQPGRDLTLEHLSDEDGYRRLKFRFQSGSAEHPIVEGEYYQVTTATPDSPAPLVQVAPILGGALDDYLLTRVFASWAAQEGCSSFFVYQEEIVLQPERGGASLERVLRRTTIENVQALELFASRPEADATRLGCFGVSMGAIRNVLLLAVEPRLRGGILLLGGADLARIVRHSHEPLVLDYLEGRARLGMSRDEVVADLSAQIVSDPIHVARYVGPERVLMVLGSLDNKVPYPAGLALHAELGFPELHVYPLGHYTGILAAPSAARLGFEWLRGRFASLSASERVE